MGLGPMEMIIILVIALVVLGPKRLPSAGRAVGESMRGFKEAISGPGEKHEDRALLKAETAEQTREFPAKRSGGRADQHTPEPA